MYQIVKKFELLITEGQFYLKSLSSFKLYYDDLIGMKVKDAQLAYRELRSGELPDYRIELTSDTTTTFDVTQFTPMDRKHYIRLVVSEPLTFSMSYIYENNGHYNIKFIAKNSFMEDEVKRDHTISIQSTISKMRLVVTPPNAAVDSKININVQLTKGSNVKLLWDMGDGSQFTDHVPG